MGPVLLIAVLAAGAAAGTVQNPSAGSAIADADILALSPEIERFLAERVKSDQARSTVLRSLMDALFGKNGLDIAYGNFETKTAIETFESRSGNCLSFTLLFVALARHVGLEAHFQEVMEILSWDRMGDVAVNNRHMFAEVETGEGIMQVDFLPGVEKRYRSVRRIDERRVLAHYFNNLGAEALAENALDRAIELFSRSLEADGTFAPAWVNLGVTHRRSGRPDQAERCYLEALEMDPTEISAASNLAGLYQATGRERKAAPYLRQLRRHRQRNPFYHFRLAIDSARKGDHQTAVRHFKRAVRRLPDDPLFRARLSRAYADAGRPRKAARSLERALELTTDEAQRALLERRLEEITGGGV